VSSIRRVRVRGVSYCRASMRVRNVTTAAAAAVVLLATVSLSAYGAAQTASSPASSSSIEVAAVRAAFLRFELAVYQRNGPALCAVSAPSIVKAWGGPAKCGVSFSAYLHSLARQHPALFPSSLTQVKRIAATVKITLHGRTPTHGITATVGTMTTSPSGTVTVPPTFLKVNGRWYDGDL
jgi:hypothetical protein